MKAALRLFLVRGLGLRSANALIKHFKKPECIFDARREEIEALGVPPEVADGLLSPKSLERAEAEAEKAAKVGVTIVDILDPSYPPLLREIFDPPQTALVAAGFLDLVGAAERQLRLASGLLRVDSFGYKILNLPLQVEAQFLVELVIQLTAAP